MDDTDLVHLSPDDFVTEEQFTRDVQISTTLWACLLQDTGGNLKLAKCYYYLLTWKFEKVIARLKMIHEMAELYCLTIPQQHSGHSKVHRKEINKASKTLGVITSPISNSGGQLKKLLDKVDKWTASI